MKQPKLPSDLWEVVRMDDLGKAALCSGGESKDTFPGHESGSLDVDSNGWVSEPFWCEGRRKSQSGPSFKQKLFTSLSVCQIPQCCQVLGRVWAPLFVCPTPYSQCAVDISYSVTGAQLPVELGELSVSGMAEPWGGCSMEIHEEKFLCKASGHFREGDVGGCPAIFSLCECQLKLCVSLGVRQRHRENGMYRWLGCVWPSLAMCGWLELCGPSFPMLAHSEGVWAWDPQM